MVDHQARAQALYDSRLYEQAEKELERLVTSNEADSYTYELLSFVQVELRRFPEAIASGKLAVQLAPEDGASHYALANAYFYAQRLNDAETAIQEAIRRDPETARYHRLASGVSYHLFRFDEALARAELALELDPASSAGMSAKVSALLALNRNDEADKLLQTALQLDPESSSLFISKGRHALLKDDFESSIAFCQEALRLNPDDDATHYAMACALHNAGRNEEAEKYIRECIRLNSIDTANYALLADILYELKRPQEAFEAAREGIKVDSNDYLPQTTLANLLIKHGQKSEAETVLQSIVEKWPDRVTPNRLMVELLLSTNRQLKGRAQAESFVANYPNQVGAHRLYVWALGNSGAKNEAKVAVEKALALFPDDLTLCESASALAFAAGRHADKLMYAQKCSRLKPEDNRFPMWEAIALIELNRLDEADKKLDEIMALGKSPANVHTNKAMIQLFRGNVDKSIWHLKQALTIDANAESAKINLVVALRNRNPIYKMFFQAVGTPSGWSAKFRDYYNFKPQSRLLLFAYWLSMPIFLAIWMISIILASPLQMWGSWTAMNDPDGKGLITPKECLQPLRRAGIVLCIMAVVALLYVFRTIVGTILFYGIVVVCALTIVVKGRRFGLSGGAILALLFLLLVLVLYVWSAGEALIGTGKPAQVHGVNVKP